MRAVVIAALALAGCYAHPTIPPLPSQGGPAWVEVTSPHFAMWTDAPVARARELVHDMEQHRDVVIGVAVHDDRAAAKSVVIALRDADEVAAFVPQQFIAYAIGVPNPVWTPVIVIAADADNDKLHVLTHELTHVIINSAVGHQPHWFAEGIATYFETARINQAATSVVVGQTPDQVVSWLRTHHPLPVASLFACTTPACMHPAFYATAWALFAFLINVHPDELAAFITSLHDAPPGTDVAFTALTNEQLDRELAQWLTHGRRLVTTYKLELHDIATADRPLADRDALAARAIMRSAFSRSPAATRAAIDAALAADPTSVTANLLLRAVAPDAPAATARAVADAHPDDWRAWWLLLPDPDAHAKLCALLGAELPAGLPAKLCPPP
jgi:hypothetical protein